MSYISEIQNNINFIIIKKNELVESINVQNINKISMISKKINDRINKTFKIYKYLFLDNKCENYNLYILLIIRLKQIVMLLYNFFDKININDNNILDMINNGKTKIKDYLEKIEFIINL